MVGWPAALQLGAGCYCTEGFLSRTWNIGTASGPVVLHDVELQKLGNYRSHGSTF